MVVFGFVLAAALDAGVTRAQEPAAKHELPFQGPGGSPLGAATKPEPDFAKCK